MKTYLFNGIEIGEWFVWNSGTMWLDRLKDGDTLIPFQKISDHEAISSRGVTFDFGGYSQNRYKKILMSL